MAYYSLACTCAQVVLPDEAVEALQHAVRLNPDLRTRVAAEPDLEPLRADGRLEAVAV